MTRIWDCDHSGSIPARAGEPAKGPDAPLRGSIPARANGAFGTAPFWVYPRACGGTRSRALPIFAPLRRVYPRACGGTLTVGRSLYDWDQGLSPRVRGNRRASKAPMPCAPGLSPRVRGNRFDVVMLAKNGEWGLSPRVRGNPVFAKLPIGTLGSIPVAWGEPCVSGHPYAFYRVYPRACGGTGLSSVGWGRVKGLSTRRCDLKLACRVYPRACGGTEGFRPGRNRCRPGSIPARAGEP